MASLFTHPQEHQLYDDWDRLQRQMEQLFGPAPRSTLRGGRAGNFPPLNIGADADEVHVCLFAPGMSAESFEVSLQQNTLVVSGTRAASEQQGGTWYLRERFSGDFRRVVSLPEDIDGDKVAASYRDGVLHIRIARRSALRPRRIEIG